MSKLLWLPSPRVARAAFALSCAAALVACSTSDDGGTATTGDTGGGAEDTAAADTAGDDVAAADATDDTADDAAEDAAADASGGGDATVSEDCGGAERVVTFTTEDGVDLVADYLPAASANRGAVVLVHMIPPGNDRSTYPGRVRAELQALDLNVLNLDRRGAGESGGVAQDAYQGPGGRLDLVAAIDWLTSDATGCTVDATALMLVGASNGTTSVLDYTVDPIDGAAPARIAWLSPGAYTEAQNAIADHGDTLQTLPILWVYPDSEPYSDAFVDDAPTAWEFVRIEDGRHGTQNFDDGPLETIQLDALKEWAAAL